MKLLLERMPLFELQQSKTSEQVQKEHAEGLPTSVKFASKMLLVTHCFSKLLARKTHGGCLPLLLLPSPLGLWSSHAPSAPQCNTKIHLVQTLRVVSQRAKLARPTWIVRDIRVVFKLRPVSVQKSSGAWKLLFCCGVSESIRMLLVSWGRY